jgi:hypothetical protein
MKCLKMNQCKPKPMVGTQKGSIPIKLSIFLLAALIMLSMATVAIAQSQAVAQLEFAQAPKGNIGVRVFPGPTTQEEDRILYKFNNRDEYKIDDRLNELIHYMRDGCKVALAGDWVWPETRDIITITYDEQYKVFLGTLTRPGPGKIRMDLPVGHLLFKVYFPKDGDPDNRYFYDEFITVPDGKIDINWLRQAGQCNFGWFKGTEFSFEERTKKKTEMNLMLILKGDQLQYKLDKNAWNLTRFR